MYNWIHIDVPLYTRSSCLRRGRGPQQRWHPRYPAGSLPCNLQGFCQKQGIYPQISQFFTGSMVIRHWKIDENWILGRFFNIVGQPPRGSRGNPCYSVAISPVADCSGGHQLWTAKSAGPTPRSNLALWKGHKNAATPLPSEQETQYLSKKNQVLSEHFTI